MYRCLEIIQNIFLEIQNAHCAIPGYTGREHEARGAGFSVQDIRFVLGRVR